MAKRTKEELDREYSTLCLELGSLEYHSTIAKGELTRINDAKNTCIQKIRKLEQEARNLPVDQKGASPEEMIESLGLKTEEAPAAPQETPDVQQAS